MITESAADAAVDWCVRRKWHVAMQPHLVTFSGQASLCCYVLLHSPFHPLCCCDQPLYVRGIISRPLAFKKKINLHFVVELQ